MGCEFGSLGLVAAMAEWHPWGEKRLGCWTHMVGGEGGVVKLSWEWVSFPSLCKWGCKASGIGRRCLLTLVGLLQL